jgi:uncharacterized protein (TIGR02453 family)
MLAALLASAHWIGFGRGSDDPGGLMAKSYFHKELFRFLAELKRNNRREWFLDNKDRYESEVRLPALHFIADISGPLKRVNKNFGADPRPVGGSLMRIYRDLRFSRDKTPYKTNVGIHFPHGAVAKNKDVQAPGFYLHLEPNGNFLAAGFWHPESATLRKIRAHILESPREWKKVKATRLPFTGESLRKPPKGFDPDGPFIVDLKRIDFVQTMPFSNSEVTSPRFLEKVVAGCRRLLPLMRFLSEAEGLKF